MPDSITARYIAPPDTSYDIPYLPVDSVPPFDARLDTARLQAFVPIAPADTTAAQEQPDWHDGMEPQERIVQAGNRSTFLFILAVMVVVMTFNFRNFGRVVKHYGAELWKVRPGRDNVFDEHPASDTRVLILLILQCVICTGILLCAAICRALPPVHHPMTALGVGLSIGVCGLYYIFQLCAYSLVGYTFTDKARRRQWLRGFNASQAVLGLALIVPAALAIFYPTITYIVVLVAAALYLIARLLFIIKGFRIFYDKIGSLLYFILYLCTLEIIPVILIYNCTYFLVMNELW